MRRPRPRFWIASLLLMLAAAAPSASAVPQWLIRTWQSDEGLPDNTVLSIEQTPDGFLWVATPAGLVRFDGLQFREFAPVTAAGIPASSIQSVTVDHRGRLWVAKEPGTVVCVDQGRTTAFTRQNGLPVGEVHVMLAEAAGAVWASYLGGALVRIEDGKVRSFTAEDGLPGGRTCQLTLGKGGKLWFAKGKSLGVYQDGRFLQLAERTAQRITGARSGGLWICTGKQVSKCAEDGAVEEVGDLPSWEPNPNPTVLCEDRNGDLWIGTKEAGLFRYDSANRSFERLTENQEILSIKEDRDGNVWVGTRGVGLTQFKPRVVELKAIDPNFPLSLVRSLCQDSSGWVWAVGANGVVYWSQGGGWTKLAAEFGWSEASAQCVAANPSGGVWIGTLGKGLHHWQDRKVVTSLSAANGLAGNFVSALLTGPSGELWCGVESADGRTSLQRRQAEQLRTFAIPSGSGLVVALAVDSSGDCWAATAKGLLLRVRGDALSDETAKTFAQPRPIRCLAATPGGSLWIGYAGQGVGRLKAGRFSDCRVDQGLPDEYISQMLPDGRGRLWFAGNRGIFSMREKDFDDLTEGRAGRVWPVAYGQNDGLPRLQASHDSWPGALRDKNDRLWFAMQSGYAVVNTADVKENPDPPTVVIERVTSNGKTVAAYGAGESMSMADSGAPVELWPGGAAISLIDRRRQLEITFTALSFKSPESIGFRYRLHGFDKDWVDAGTRRVASYPQIPPGNYRYELIACNSDGVWTATGAGLTINVAPGWWETTWFRVLAPLAAFGLLGNAVLLVVRRRHRRQIERLQLLEATERERIRIARDLHDDLGAGLTQISLNTAMVQNPAVSREVADGLLQEIDQRSRELVTSLDEIVWAVNPKNDTVPSLARYLCQFAQHCMAPGEIVCLLDVAPNLPETPVGAEQRHHLFLAFKEALHNTLRHSGANQLEVSIKVASHILIVELRDNGRGFVLDSAPEGADGLVNMRERLERLGGTCQVTGEPGRGTTVVFRLPLPAERSLAAREA